MRSNKGMRMTVNTTTIQQTENVNTKEQQQVTSTRSNLTASQVYH